MRLITHNMLTCNKNKCTGGYPLKIELDENPNSFKIESQPVNPEFIKKLLPRIDYKALYTAASSLSVDLPMNYMEEDTENNNFINTVHHAIFNVSTVAYVTHRIVVSHLGRQTDLPRIPNMLHSNLEE
ncbi:hypothetical protein BEWA_010540 [Theileria equi strain WA]|uniref:Uncharacterized protein n=1 Tax=Theileria equi strain WA TaxID=1537102 RepID=L0B193_THEEQ|nr:hypothetical protein BEWA_010540 [Theileria equi strain WA]AFZ81637.1 hypothetical protein BEWA_010540 [Theileria equi strain WA]|eukprot:XP_004831303.1 hypothetical protein BEWA_010540 [Theileria equi strain WA]